MKINYKQNSFSTSGTNIHNAGRPKRQHPQQIRGDEYKSHRRKLRSMGVLHVFYKSKFYIIETKVGRNKPFKRTNSGLMGDVTIAN